MRVKSIYKVYQVMFGYPQARPGTRRVFARAIQDCLGVIEEVSGVNSYQPIVAYSERPYPFKLATGFLSKYRTLMGDSRNIEAWVFTNSEIALSPRDIRRPLRRDLRIDLPYLVSTDGTELVIPTFGRSTNIDRELPVLRALMDLGVMQPPLPAEVRIYTYWDLQNGLSTSRLVVGVEPANPDSVLLACAQIVDQQRAG